MQSEQLRGAGSVASVHGTTDWRALSVEALSQFYLSCIFLGSLSFEGTEEYTGEVDQCDFHLKKIIQVD